MATPNILTTRLKALKQHWESCPVAVFLLLSWSILPVATRLLAFCFIVVMLLYDIVNWRYRKWPNGEELLPSKIMMKRCHLGLVVFLFLTPIVSIGAYHIQHGVPKLLDEIVLSATSEPSLTNKVTAYYFSHGTPHPTNYTVAYFGIARTNSAVLFESKPFFCFATEAIVKGMTSFGGVILLLCLVAMFFFAGFEHLIELLRLKSGSNVVPPGK